MKLKLFSYSIVRFVADPARGEQVNLGVIVVSDTEHESRGQFLPAFKQRVSAIEPDCDPAAIAKVLGALRYRVGSSVQMTLQSSGVDYINSTPKLAALAAAFENQVQLSAPKLYRAASIDTAASELYGDLVAPLARTSRQPIHMTVGRIRELIGQTVTRWRSSSVVVGEQGVEQVRDVGHYADYWVTAGEPIAAFIAIPDDPDERDTAWFRRDAVVEIARTFSRINPEFRAVAVFPPKTDDSKDEDFLNQTRVLYRDVSTALALRTDELPALREKLLPKELPFEYANPPV